MPLEPQYYTFRLVHSSLYSYLFLTLLERNDILDVIPCLVDYTQEYIDELVHENFKDINPEFRLRIDILENCTSIREQNLQIIQKLKYKASKFYLDSGGLQLFRARIGSLKRQSGEDKESFFKKYIPLQVYADVAIALDDIPVSPSEVEECAKGTVENIYRQINIFKSMGKKPILLPVLSPLLIPDAIDKWSDLLLPKLDFSYDDCITHGFAFGGVAQAFTKKIQFNLYLMMYYIAQLFKFVSKYKNFCSNDDIMVHFLGLMDTKHIDILVCLPLLKKIKCLSTDGRSLALNYIYGTFPDLDSNGKLVYKTCNGTCDIFLDSFTKVLLFFDDILVKELQVFKSIDEIIRHAVMYLNNIRTDKTCIAHRIGVLTTCLVGTIFRVHDIVHSIKQEIDNYSKIIEQIEQDYYDVINKTKMLLVYSSAPTTKIDAQELF